MRSGFWRHWRRDASSGRQVTVVEWREDSLLALRATTPDDGPPVVQDTVRLPCPADAREATIARLARQGWFTGGRNIVMLGIRQRQLAMLPRPTVPDAELVEAARWQLQGALDYPPEEAVLDVLRLGEDEPPARQQLAVFAVRRSELSRWLAPFSARKVRLEAVEVADCAQRNLAALHSAKGQPVAMLSHREGSIVFSVTRGSEVLVSRSFDASGARAAPGADASADVAALAERVGLQLQRMLDTLERRSAAMAPAQILVLLPSPHAALLSQCAELTGLRLLPLDLGTWMVPAQPSTDRELAESAGDMHHLFGAALRPAPRGAGA
jgi:MSHA biogenesis protein MshI